MICLSAIRLEQYMKTARVSLCLATLLSWALVSPAWAQQQAPTSGSQASPGGPTNFGGWPEEAQPGTDDIHTRSLFDNRNFMLRTDAGDGVGYIRGYQTFAAFQPVAIVPNELIMWMSPRGYVTYNSGSFAGNLGTGLRWLNPATNRILGGGVWWDHDNNGTNTYDQLGGSLEWLGKYFDLRANAYIPTNQNTHLISQYFNNNNVFILNNIGVGQTTITNSALRGGDFEGGGALPGIGDLGVRTYAGGYYYQGPSSDGGIYGVRARLEALITQDIWGSVAVTHDRVFGTNVNASATIYLFTGNEPRWFQRIPMETRLYQQQERQYRVAVQQNVENDTILALRAGGTGGSGGPVGTPIFVLHVDNTAPPGGNGTVEHPLNALPTSTPANVDIVFVDRGNGTSSNMNQGITLNNFERLLGQGVQHQFTDTNGTFTLPGFSPGPLPTITNTTPGGSAVTLASHNEVSGFNITGSALNGITGTNIVDFNINNVNITNSGNRLGVVPIGAGIQLTNATGTGIVTQSTINNNSAEGIRIDNSAGGILNLGLANVSANSNLTGIELNATGSTINPTFVQTTANSNVQDGISISLAPSGGTRSTMVGSFDHVTASGNNPTATGNTLVSGLLQFGNGFTYNSSASDGAISITHSTFSGNQLNGVSFTTTNNSTLDAALINNTPIPTTATSPGIFSNVRDGVLFTNTDSQVVATLLNNTVSTNGGFGIGAVSNGTGAFTTSFNLTVGGYLTQDTNGDGTFTAAKDQVAIASLGSTIIGNGILDREGNTIIGNHGAGVAFTLLDQGTGSANIIGNTIQSTQSGGVVQPSFPGPAYTGSGIDLRVTGSTIASNSTASFTGGTIDANTIGSLTTAGLGNAGNGISVLADQLTSLQNLNIGTLGHGNVIGNNGGDGINITRGDVAHMGDTTPVMITNNNIQSNLGNGISISALGSFDSIVNEFVIQQNNIQHNQQNGILLHVEADAQIGADILNNVISNNLLDGIRTTELAGSPGDLRGIGGTWSGNTITFNGSGGNNAAGTNNGIWLDAAVGNSLENLLIGSLVSAADGNIIQNNSGHGILINGAGNVEISFNLIDSNATGGIYINALPTNNISIDSNVITNNGTLQTPGNGVDGGDGIQIVNTGVGSHTEGIVDYSVTITSNTIRGNAGRGINILNQTVAQTSVDIENNQIIGNRLEGIYVVNTASGTQTADVTGEVLLHADGSATVSAARLDLIVNNNDIEGNGIDSLLTATGLVVRVGTSDGNFGSPTFFDGGFYNDPIFGPLGGVGAVVTNNTFHGNLGDDISFSAFNSVSQASIIASAGTRDATQLTFTAYGTDPLARLDLTFHNNTFDSSPNNGGNVVDSTDAGSIVTTNSTTIAAQFNNSDTFKSPVFSATLPGPYLSNTRFRNGERLAGRFLGFLPPAPGSPPLYDEYLYPGEGQSTFRLLGSTTAADVAQAGFFTDVAPYTSPNDANGVFRAGATPDELPFGWTFLNGAAAPARPQ
jgi:hypothetical protein